MLSVENGYELLVSAPISYNYHFQTTSRTVNREIITPFDPFATPKVMINDMNEQIRIVNYYDSSTDPTMDEVTKASISFRLLSEPNVVYTLSSAQSELYPGVWFPAINGSPRTGHRSSAVPLRFCITTTNQTCHVRNDGSIYYTTDAPFVAIKGQYGSGIEWLIPRDNNILHNYNGILIMPQSITQEDYLYTVSGGL